MKSKRKLKKPVKIILIFITTILIVLIGFLFIYKLETGKVNNNKKIVIFEVEKGSTYNSIAHSLKKNNLIKSEFFYKIYVKLNNPSNLQEGIYELRSNMNVNTLVNTLEGNAKTDLVEITFKEGIDFPDVVDLISEKLKIDSEKIYEKTSDEKYLDTLIKKYWFLTDDIKNKDIYYPLEGYLYPDTYMFNEKNSIEEIIEIMLDNMEKKLSKYKNDMTNNEYSIHEIITMASIVEKEASNSNDRAGVAGVFYNRLNNGMSLGSDVTTYYGLKLPLSERDLTVEDLASSNGYNTRNSNMAGKLPVGPICIPNLESIEAAINPTESDYLYFVADKNGKTYFAKNAYEHEQNIAKLKSEGLWYEY